MKMKSRMKKIFDVEQALGRETTCKEEASMVAAIMGDEVSESDALLASLIHNEHQAVENLEKEGASNE